VPDLDGGCDGAILTSRPGPVRCILRDLVVSVFELFFPPACARCGGGVGAGALCDPCRRALPRLPRTSIARPGSRLAALVAEVPYAGEIEHAIHRFKYPRPGLLGLDPAPEALLCALLLDAAARLDGPRPDLIVPVPQHPAGLRRRGFNPAALLARAVARARGLPLAPRALEKLRDTPSQTGLDRHARRRNVAHVFRTRPGLRLPPRVWLIDDVITTGATLEEAARAARRGGAREVSGLCVAHTPLVQAIGALPAG
jgi:ComF family protein